MHSAAPLPSGAVSFKEQAKAKRGARLALVRLDPVAVVSREDGYGVAKGEATDRKGCVLLPVVEVQDPAVVHELNDHAALVLNAGMPHGVIWLGDPWRFVHTPWRCGQGGLLLGVGLGRLLLHDSRVLDDHCAGFGFGGAIFVHGEAGRTRGRASTLRTRARVIATGQTDTTRYFTLNPLNKLKLSNYLPCLV